MSPLPLFEKPKRSRPPRVESVTTPKRPRTEPEDQPIEAPSRTVAPRSEKPARKEPTKATRKAADKKNETPTPRSMQERAQQFVRHYGLYLIIGIVGVFVLTRFRPAPPQSDLSSVFTPEIQHWQTQILAWATRYGIDPNLVATIMQIESCGSPTAVSSASAQGLFQVMPANFAPEVTNQLDPQANANAGLGVLKDCLRWANNDVSKALACYNGGPSLISQAVSNWPLESQHYATWGAGIYGDATRRAAHSSALDNWLASGGAGLCDEAAVNLGISTRGPDNGATTFAPPLTALPTFAAGQAIVPPTVTPAVRIYLTP